MAPASAGLAAAARLRGTDVTLAAAARSSGATTAMTYEVRVGTSIWESALRTSSRKIAIGKARGEGHERKAEIGRQVREHHGVEKPDPVGDPGGGEIGQSGEHACPEEDGAGDGE